MKITGSILILILALPACDSVRASQVPDDGVPSASVVDPDFSPGGPYAGPLVIPSISRFRNLPNRMDLEPLILPPDTVLKIDERLVPLFERVLQEATDAELQEVAALSLARVAEEKLADIRGTATALLQVLRSSRNERIRFACAYALAAGNVEAAAPELIQLASKRSDDQRLLIEPALARWKVQSAVDLWRPRLTDPDISDVSFRLAAEGLTALNDAASLEPLRQIVADSSADFGMRMSAAKAVAILNPDQAFAAAEQHTDGSVQDRLLAIALLDNSKTESHAPTARLCDDRSDSIAAAAWQQLYRRSPELLVNQLPTGCTHRSAQVRIAAARVIEVFPNAERTEWLHQLLSDVHIEVRNVARAMLVIVAEETPDLREQIVGLAGDALQPDSKDWQGIEQALILLGQLKATQFSQQCIPLLDYPRDEVSISAAWLIHLFPDESVRDAVLSTIRKMDELLLTQATEYFGNPGPPHLESALKQSFLIQYGGLVRMREIQPILETKFSKTDPGGYLVRTAAMWTLGMLFEKNPVPELAAKFEERIKDRATVPPESRNVRRASVMALGLMRAVAFVPVVQEAYSSETGESLVPGTARWVLPLLGQPVPAEIPVMEEFSGGWRINVLEEE